MTEDNKHHRRHHPHAPDAGSTGQDDCEPGTNDHDYEDCVVTLSGVVRCPKCHKCPPPLEYDFFTKVIDCSNETLSVELTNFMALPANLHKELVSIVDIGHAGWLMVFRKATIWP